MLGSLPKLVRIGVWLVIGALFVRGCMQRRRPAPALVVGSGLHGGATVEARTYGGPWQTCAYARVRGEYVCDGIVTVSDATANLVNDAPPSWPLIAPAVVARAQMREVEVRFSRRQRLNGRYWAAASAHATLALGDGRELTLGKTKQELDLPDGERTLQVTAKVPFPTALEVTFVATDRVEPGRPFLAPPPNAAPAAVRAIR